MQLAKEIAGFSGAKADDLRKAIGKKNREAMAKLKPEFFDGCRASGTSEPVIEQLWTTNERSADYSFNKSHSACYALIAYRTAWLKANYPAEYMAALISSGLDAVKGVGFAAVEAIKRARGDYDPPARPFQDLWDFCGRVDGRAVNKKAIEALIKCGAFGSTGASRKGMLAVLEQAQAAGQKAQQDALIGQGSIFDLGLEAAVPDSGSGSALAAQRFAAPSHASIPADEF